MSKKKINEIAGVIDIGSNELRLKIAQNSGKKLKVIESLTYPLSLGRDTFDKGAISFEKMNKACDIIENFLKVASEYGVSKLRVVATTALREASNKDYILDQIKIKTNTTVEVLDDTQEKLYIYKLMTHLLGDSLKKSALMVYTGSGNVGVSLLENGRMPFLQNIKIGSLRISEIFMEIQEYSSEFYLVLEEFLVSFTDTLEDRLPKSIVNYIAAGQEIELIAKLCKAENKGPYLSIPRNKFLEVYGEVKDKSIDRISKDYGIAEDKAEVLLPAMCIYINLLNLTQADKIIAMPVFLSESLLFEMLYPNEFANINKEYNKNAVLSARAIAAKYGALEEHYSRVEKFALSIFDKMKKVHGMSSRDKLLLHVAAILHDVGKYINLNRHYRHSYYIVKSCDIVGLNLHETEIAANICLFHSRLLPSAADDSYSSLDTNDRVLVSKLAAILRIADALDRSHEQKFDSIDVELEDDKLLITIETDKNIQLEQWSFDDKSDLFKEVFGMRAVIKKKRVV